MTYLTGDQLVQQNLQRWITFRCGSNFGQDYVFRENKIIVSGIL